MNTRDDKKIIKQTEKILTEVFFQESIENEEKFLKENGININAEHLKNFYEVKEKLKKLTENELENVAGGIPNLRELLNSIFNIIEVTLEGTTTYLRTNSVAQTTLNVGLAITENWAQDRAVQEVERRLGNFAGSIARTFFIILNSLSVARATCEIMENDMD